MKKILFLFLCFFVPALLQALPLNLSVHSEAAIVMNAETGVILYEKNAYKSFYPASTTKIATALYALHLAGHKLDKMLVASRDCLVSISEEAKRRSGYTLPSHWLETDASHMGLKNDEQMSLRDLLHGMMVVSGDDASNVIAKELGGTIPQFMEKLNSFVQEKGCENTFFTNAHGLHHPNHVSTAYDTALLTKHALRNPTFREIVGTVHWVRPKTNKQEAVTLSQTNRLLRKGPHYYPKAIGVKTGYTSHAQKCLVAAAKNGERTLIAVLFKAKERKDALEDAITLFDAAFSQSKVERVVLKKGPQTHTLFHEGASRPIQTYAKNTIVLEFYPAEEPEIQGLLYWREIDFPIQKDQPVGEVHIQTSKGEPLHIVPLFARENVPASWAHWLKTLFD